jgi:hypothetical protein
VLGKGAVVKFRQVSKPLEELPVENSILLQSPRLVLFELLERICLWVVQLSLAVARYDLALEFKGCILLISGRPSLLIHIFLLTYT